MALKYENIQFEHWFVCDFDKYAIKAYNQLHDTNYETSDIRNITAKNLNIVDTDKHEYLLTYSFPCTDLSKAGKGKGMSKDDNTRSGLLWEVERLLNECKELPQYLLMENVPDVIGSKNIKDFALWIEFLDSLGYKSYYQILNAKDYGIPQNRNRCFMVSFLDKSRIYEFPKPIPLKLKLKDMLEDNVDEKYYLSEKMIQGMLNTKFESYKLENKVKDLDGIADTIIARFDGTPQCIEIKSTTICLNSKVNGKQPSLQDRIYDTDGISTAITTSFMPSILIPEATKKGYAEAYEGDGIYLDRPHQKRGVVQKGMIQTIKCSGNDVGVVTNNLKIRKLTPCECWRLMGVKDEDFDKLHDISNSQLYKLAGNSIVTNVLQAIFRKMFIDTTVENYQMSMFDLAEESEYQIA